MRRIRCAIPEPRLDLLPLIDVVFLLLTFFIFSLVLLVRADVLDVRLPALTSARPADRAQLLTVALDRKGELYLDGRPVRPQDLIPLLHDRLRETPDARLLIAADEQGASGDLLSLLDRLSAAGLGEFAVMGRSFDPAARGEPDSAPRPGER